MEERPIEWKYEETCVVESMVNREQAKHGQCSGKQPVTIGTVTNAIEK
jgi:hypothetical protein